MESQKVDMFMLSNGKYFPEEQVSILRERLLAADESKWGIISSLQYKSPTTSLILSLLLGCYGIDRFYLGHIGLGVGKLITCGGLGIWAIVDWFLIMNATRNVNLQRLQVFL